MTPDPEFKITISRESGMFSILYENFQSQPLSAASLLKVITAWAQMLPSIPGSETLGVLKSALAAKKAPKREASADLSLDDLF